MKRLTQLLPSDPMYDTPLKWDSVKVMLRCRPMKELPGMTAETPWAEVLEVNEDGSILARIDNHVLTELHGYSVHEEVIFCLEQDPDEDGHEAKWWTAHPKETE
jgi:hypothetical protein